jgi:hypothetical protein
MKITFNVVSTIEVEEHEQNKPFLIIHFFGQIDEMCIREDSKLIKIKSTN